jgi:hypothetical protein
MQPIRIKIKYLLYHLPIPNFVCIRLVVSGMKHADGQAGIRVKRRDCATVLAVLPSAAWR